jgi:hypothetical protein
MAATHFQHLHATRHIELIRQADDFRLRRTLQADTSRRLSRAFRRLRPGL